MPKYLIIPVFLLTILNACAMPEKSESEAIANEQPVAAAEPVVNDYPTRDRVDYVLECVAKHGGL
ncbi:MAG: hypothetical protein ABSB19_20225, partial [Methylomonas sp.]